MLSRAMNGGWRSLAIAPSLCCLLLVLSVPGMPQNLVPNPSFELNDTCPYTIGFQGNAKPLYWESWNQSPDYFNTCAGSLGGIDTLIRVPLNGFGFQYSLHGEAYVGMYAYATAGGGVESFREYVGCELLEPLDVGETYELSYFANLAFGGTYWVPTWACNNMGMLFTMEPNIWDVPIGQPFALRNYAHLYSQSVISDTANWTLVSGSFTADSAYRYLVIGNFFSNALTDTLHIIPGNSLGAYYFVDGVCVTRAGQPCEFTLGIPGSGHAEPAVWPNPVSDRLHVRAGRGTAWQVFDLMGRVLQSGVSGEDLLILSVSHWASGEYVIRLQGKQSWNTRFVVMR